MPVFSHQALDILPLSAPQRGFTLVELIMVMVVVGILSVFAAPKLFDANVFRSYGAADQAKAALRYAQKIAIAQRRSVDVVFSSAAVSDCGTELVGGDVSCVISNSVAVPSVTVTFDALGQPVPNAESTIVIGTAPNATTLTIEANTGYVH